jgi:hypothetical protein
MVNCSIMNAPRPRAADPDHRPDQFSQADEGFATEPVSEGFDPDEWIESQPGRQKAGAGGRAVLGTALTILAILWTGYTAWSAGQTLAGQPLTSPLLAQWVAIAAGPLALLGLVWLMFGRTRRKEAEKFTRSVVAMRTEARSLEGLLEVLQTRIADSHQALQSMTERLMKLGDEATGRLGGITQELDSSTAKLARHGEVLDRAAESARTDIAVLLEDLPRAEATARSIAQELRTSGAETSARTAELTQQVSALAEQTQTADEIVASAAQRLVAHLTHIESAGAAAAARVSEAETGFSSAVDSLLERTASTLDEIRTGIDVQSSAVTALVDQARAAMGTAGIEAAAALGANVGQANSALDGLSARVAEQERTSQRMISEIDRGLALINERFVELAAHGDERAEHFLTSLARARAQLDAMAEQSGTQDGAIDSLAERTVALRESMELLAVDIRQGLTGALAEAHQGAEQLYQSAAGSRNEISAMRDAVQETSERISATGESIAEQRERLGALLAAVDQGVGGAESKLAGLVEAISTATREADRLSGETGPGLVAAMVQVREAAAHAAERAREAMASVIPESANKLSAASKDALEKVIRESIEDRLREVEQVAARAVDAARAASDRLTQQMLTIGQSAAALEQHLEKTNADQREKDSEQFARRVAMLMDSMHSAAIDVGKILSDESDDKAWGEYLKGNRGVFTRRAVRLMAGGETRAIRAHYESDPEFQQSVNRYVHDFEAMLRRVLAERDGGMIAVTLMSSDMGKLYAALAQVIDKRR